MSVSLRRLIDKQIAGDSQMSGMLAKYNDAPACFYQKSPSDSRSGWGDIRYPRMDFNVDMRHDPERKTQGTLTFNIWCNTECPAVGNEDPDRAIEQRLMELISGTLYTDIDGTVCAEWERSDEFVYESSSVQNSAAPEIYGLTITFELMEFPEQITVDPDPIQGLNVWTKRHFPAMAVIAYDTLPSVWKPSDSSPAIYWRFEGTASINKQSYAVTWYTGTFTAHVMANSITERNKWTKALIEKAQIDGEIILADTSPMFINSIAVRHDADPLRDGQLTLTGQYGVLSQPSKEPAQVKLTHPHYRNPYQ